MGFADNLKFYRTKKHLSQTMLASKIGVQQGSIANYEKGNRKPTIELVVKIALVLEVTTDELLGMPKPSMNSSKDIHDLIEDILWALLHKNEYEVFKSIEALYFRHKDISMIFDEVIKPIMYEIGNMWKNSQLNIGDEHYAAEVITRMIDWLSVVEMKQNNKGKKAVCMSVSSEQHTLGIKMVSVVLEKVGYQTIYLGSNLPTRDLIEILRKEGPDLLLLSTTLMNHGDSLVNLIDRIKSIPELNSILIVVGGQGLSGDIELEKMKQVFIIKSIKELENWLEQLQ